MQEAMNFDYIQALPYPVILLTLLCMFFVDFFTPQMCYISGFLANLNNIYICAEYLFTLKRPI